MKRLLVLAVLAVAMVCGPRAAVSDGGPVTERIPRPADGIVDTIGINVHLSYNDTGYRFLTPASPAPNGLSVLRALQMLGVRHVRGGVTDMESHGLGSTTAATGPGGRCAVVRAAAAAGVDFLLVTDVDDEQAQINTSAGDLRLAVTCMGSYASHIAAIEGPNERGSGRHCNGVEPPPAPPMGPYLGSFREHPTSECIPEIMGQQRIMWLARRDGMLPASTQLWSAAFANTACEEEYDIAHYTDAYGKHLADYVDAVTAHAYLAYNEPEWTGGPGPYRNVPCSATAHLNGGTSNATYNYINDAAYGSLKYYHEAVAYSGTVPDGGAAPKPAVISETGYAAQCCGNSDTDVDVPTVAKYTLREVLAAQTAGFVKTYFYELISDSESLGLTDQYLNPKPVYCALQNFITLLRDPGHAAFVTTPFALGVDAPSDVQNVLYEKHDGSQWLVLWQNDRGFDHAVMAPIRVAPANVTVRLRRAPSALTYFVFDAATGRVTPKTIAPATAFTLRVTDMPAILRIGVSPVGPLATPMPPVYPTAVHRLQTVSCRSAGRGPAVCTLPHPFATGAIPGHVLVVSAVGNPTPAGAPNAAFTHDGGTRCGENDAVEVAHRNIAAADARSLTFTPAKGAVDTQFTLDELAGARLPLIVSAGCIIPAGTRFPSFGSRIALPDYAGMESYWALRLSGSDCGSFDAAGDEIAQLASLDTKVCSRDAGSGGGSVFAAASLFGGYAAGRQPTLTLPGVAGVRVGPQAQLTWWVPHS